MTGMDNGQIILFQTQGGETKIEVRLADDTSLRSPLAAQPTSTNSKATRKVTRKMSKKMSKKT